MNIRNAVKIIVVILTVGVLSGIYFVRNADKYLIVQNELQKQQDVIIVLTGNRYRVISAAELFKYGYGKKFIIAGNEPQELEYMQRRLASAGVEKSNIIIERQSENTMENAVNSVKIMQQQGMRRAIVVTSAIHTRRAAWCFNQAAAPGVQFSYCAYPDDYARDEDKTSLLSNKTQNIIVEYAKLILYKTGIAKVRGMLGRKMSNF